jgi:hypothetical protein
VPKSSLTTRVVLRVTPGRSCSGVTETGCTRGAQEWPVHKCGSERCGRHACMSAQRSLLPVGLRPLSMGGTGRQPSAEIGCGRTAFARRRCILRVDCSLASRPGRSAMRSDRGHNPRSGRQWPQGWGSGSSGRPQAQRHRDEKGLSNHVRASYGGRPRLQGSADRRSRRRRHFPACESRQHRRAARLRRHT